MLGQLRALYVALLEKQLRRERTGGRRRSGAGCVVDDRVLDVSLVGGLGIRVEYLSSQSICYSIAEPADVEEDAFVGEIGQQAAAVGDSDASVEGDRFPHPVNVGFGDAMVGSLADDRTTARLASASGPAGRVRMSSMPPR